MEPVHKGLVIREPWIDLLLSGKKTWEMRGQRPSYRGWIGLIRKGSGRVSGVARLVDVGHPLSPDEMVATFDKHRIPEAMIRSGEVAKWTTPWKLADLRVLPKPVPYRHPNGAITLFSLEPQVSEAILAQLGELPPAKAEIPAPVSNSAVKPAPTGPGPSKVQPAPVRSPQSHVSGSLLGETVLTEGNIKNNHFYLTPFLGRFPASMFGGTNDGTLAPQQALIDWGGASPVETDIPSDKKMFRRRGWVRQFFADNDAEPEDIVCVHQTAPFRYRVSLKKKGRR
ncbi:ASCH domain-containing protein [Brucella pseudintermedia]|uniref:ASCH domain-containing protein n=1 Tax=Brucella pseudintermedia TaxID=370111 RepID=UPI0030F433B6